MNDSDGLGADHRHARLGGGEACRCDEEQIGTLEAGHRLSVDEDAAIPQDGVEGLTFRGHGAYGPTWSPSA